MSSSASSSSAPVVHLQPPPIPHAGTSKWSSSGRSLAFTLSPVSTDLAAFVTPKNVASSSNMDVPAPKVDGVFEQDRAVYFAKWADVDEGLNELYTESHTIFSSLQEIYTSSLAPHLLHQADAAIHPSQNLGVSALGAIPPSENGTDGGLTSVFVSQDKALRPNERQVGYYRAIVGEYRKRVEAVSLNEKNPESIRDQHRTINSILGLTSILYLPAPSQSESIIGEQLLDWVNANNFRQTLSTANVTPVQAARRPWEEEEFWPIIFKAILRGLFPIASSLLKSLENHPQPSISTFATILDRHLDSAPRSTDPVYTQEHQFYYAHIGWKNALKAQVMAFGKGRPRGEWFEYEAESGEDVSDDIRDQMRDWEEYLMVVADLLSGDEEVVMRECEDWMEVLGAWGVLVDVKLKRTELPDVLDRILDEKPADTTMVGENIQVALIQGDVAKALVSCNDFDLWLAAHLTDVLDKMGLVDDDEEAFENALRDHFIFAYTELLQSNAAYWNITCDYLKTCGQEGIGRMQAVLLRTSLDGGMKTVEEGDGGMQVDGAAPSRIQRKVEKINDVLRVCAKNGLEREMKEICQNGAIQLADQEAFGEALTYAARSGKGSLVIRLADQILELYIAQGMDKFCAAASTIPLRLVSPQKPAYPFLSTESIREDDDTTTISSDFDTSALPPLHLIARLRLTFLVKYRDFLYAVRDGERQTAAGLLIALFSSEVVPLEFKAVLLMDSVEYLTDASISISSKDAFELLRHIEEVTQGSTFAPQQYLSALRRLTASSVKSGGGSGETEKEGKQEDWEETIKALSLVRIAALSKVGLEGMNLIGGR